MALICLLVAQLALTAGAAVLLWRKLERIGADVAQSKRMLESLQLTRVTSVAQVRTRAYAESAYAGPLHAPEASAPQAWTQHGAPPLRRGHRFAANESADESDAWAWRANVSPETGRVIAAAAMALAPVLGFAVQASAVACITAGLGIAAALMLVSLRPLWSAAAWVSVLAGFGWSLTGFFSGDAAATPAAFATLSALAGAAGLAHARLRHLAPGVTLALLMGSAMLALGGGIGMISPAGAAYGVLVAIAAIVGASSARVSGLHLTAFAAAFAGLFVLSGEDSAAIFFTPATTWTGAVFFAIGAVRAPMLGARGALYAATGVAAPLLAVSALYLSQHALEEPLSAAGAYAMLALVFAALLALTSQRSARGLKDAKLTAWIIAAAALVSASLAVALALPPLFKAAPMSAIALALMALNRRAPERLWRTGALASLALAAIFAWQALSPAWPGLLGAAATLIAPAALAGAAAAISQRRAPGAAATFEAASIAAGAGAIIALLRLALSGGAPNLAPLGFVEAGAEIAALALISLGLSWRSHRGAAAVRSVASAAFAALALTLAAICALLWFTPYWSDRPGAGLAVELLQHAPLGFALPAMAAWAHWAHWRERHGHVRARTALAAAALLTAAFIALEIIQARTDLFAPRQLDWLTICVVTLAFALALGVNFAPGVTAEREPPSHFHKYFQRHRRREQR